MPLEPTVHALDVAHGHRAWLFGSAVRAPAHPPLCRRAALRPALAAGGGLLNRPCVLVASPSRSRRTAADQNVSVEFTNGDRT